MSIFSIDQGRIALEEILRRYSGLKLSDANEAETRLKIIDEILRNMLGWELEDLQVEKRCSEDKKINVTFR